MRTPCFFLRFILFGVFLILPMVALTEPELSHEDRLYDLEAQLVSLRSELDATKSLASQERANAFNPSISVVGDLLGQGNFNSGKKTHHHHGDHQHHSSPQHGILIREVEFELRGEVDPFADALVAFAIEPRDFHRVDLHLEEAYARIKKWPGLGFSPFEIKAGMFKAAIGRINRIHRHNIPYVNYPFSTSVFLGDEGYSAPGLSFNTAFALSPKSALNVVVEGIFNRRLPIQDKGAERTPSVIGHAWWHQEMAPSHFLDLGGSTLLGRKGGHDSGAFWLLGSDIHYSYIPAGYGQDPMFLLGNELYAANKEQSSRWPVGDFVWGQMRLFTSSFIGVLYDLAPKEEDLLKFRHTAGVFLTHYTSEFLRFRLGYDLSMSKFTPFTADHRLMLSMIFILGSHPVEPYFVNR